jgi:hypothetical protein
LKTINGGSGWAIIYNGGSGGYLFSVFFPDAATGYAVGYEVNPGYGRIIKTIDSGTNWIIQPSGTSKSLNSVFFSDSDIGYAVGAGETILKTVNGGTNWFSQTSGPSIVLNSVCFPVADTGYAVGENGVILKTTNGGGVGLTERSLKSSPLKIYPNPVKDILTIERLKEPANSVLSVSDVYGREVIKMKIMDHRTQIDVSSLPGGVYVLKVMNTTTVEGYKITKL